MLSHLLYLVITVNDAKLHAINPKPYSKYILLILLKYYPVLICVITLQQGHF